MKSGVKQMDEMLFAEKKQAIGKLTAEEQTELIKDFKIEVIFNELERRELERLELLKKLDDITAFLGGMAR